LVWKHYFIRLVELLCLLYILFTILLVFLQENDDEGNDDNLEVLKIMRTVEFRTTTKWNWLDYFKVDVSIRILTNVIDYTMLRSSMSHEHLFIFSNWVLHILANIKIPIENRRDDPFRKGVKNIHLIEFPLLICCHYVISTIYCFSLPITPVCHYIVYNILALKHFYLSCLYNFIMVTSHFW